jgi:hypothetical protein
MEKKNDEEWQKANSKKFEVQKEKKMQDLRASLMPSPEIAITK